MNIKDIASLANVSVSTVSKIINKKDDAISDETRKKVLEIIKKYQYEPYSEIKKKQNPHSGLIGILIPPNANEQLFELVSCIEQDASRNGYSIVLKISDFQDSMSKRSIQVIIGKKADGIIVYTDNKKDETIYSLFQDQDIPVVLLNKTNIHMQQNIVSVFCEKKQIGLMAANYLISKGHHNIGCILSSDLQLSDNEIYEGYIQALYNVDILSDEAYVIIDSDPQKTIDSVKSLLNMNVTAFLCEDSKQALALYGMLQQFGLSVPRDVSIISAGDSAISEIMTPKLTAIRYPILEVSNTAINHLINLIENKKKPKELITDVEPILIERDSVAAPNEKKGQRKKIIVIGSMNMDINIYTDDFPEYGKVLVSSRIALIPGGKGANQAVGVGKLGGQAYAIGRLGNDNDGKEIYTSLANNYVKTDGIIFDTLMPTGKAYVSVAKDGESGIVLYQGANSRFYADQIEKFKHLFEDAEYCLISTEIPYKTVKYAIKTCNKRNVKVILKPSMIQNIDIELLRHIDYFIPNENELNQLIPGENTVYEKADYCFKQGVKNIIVTLGAKGCYLKNKDYEMHFPAADFTPVDTTGAADAFISALAVYLSEGNSITQSIRFATYAAGISITREGVQPALPDRTALDIYFDKIEPSEK
ncbi:MAG TPA: PfkB family carbohydrate kinase [Clostridiales bacterium]|nr:PfkB family carbohydrate kinase [Clostridiales bacterium]